MRKIYTLLLFVIIIFDTCHQKPSAQIDDFESIKSRDTIIAGTLNTSTSYFIYRDQEMGFHYDMVKNFADSHNIHLKIVVANNSGDLINMLSNNELDMIAYGMPVNNVDSQKFIYCGFEEISHQVLVQYAKQDSNTVTDVTQLIGKEVYVIQNSKYDSRINNLNKELGGGILIRYIDNDTMVVEDLVRKVSFNEINFTVAQDNEARLNQTYFRNLDVHLPVSFDQLTSWMVRADSPALADSLNAWFHRTNNNHITQRLAKRYFEASKGYNILLSSSATSLLSTGQISPWDHYFKTYGKQFKIDWKLLASVSYNESSFDPDGVSWAGAGGLMGLMPATATAMGVDKDMRFDYEENIKAGTKYLRELLDTFSSVPDENERIKIALASYNGGIGHLSDARALAEKYNADKNIWEGHVEKFLHLKRLEHYYKDPVCKSGYFRADETINYVQNVINKWIFYKENVK